MFKVFLDASGHHKGAPLLTVAACVARVAEWKDFEHAWRPVVKKSGQPYFHAKDSHSDLLRGPLLKVVKKSVSLAVVASMKPSDYEKVTTERYRSVMGGALAACAFTCAYQIHNWTMKHGGDQSIYAFEAGDPGIEHIHRVFNSLVVASRVEHKWRVAMVATVNKAEFPELATADFLAHVKSTGDGVWLNRWKQSCDVIDCQVPHKELRDTSEEIAKLIAINRAERRRASKLRRLADR